VAAPEASAAEQGHEQNFDVIASLSEILKGDLIATSPSLQVRTGHLPNIISEISAQFLAMTTGEGVPRKLTARVGPGAVARLLEENYRSKQLPMAAHYSPVLSLGRKSRRRPKSLKDPPVPTYLVQALRTKDP
jgi:hypothetical protein